MMAATSSTEIPSTSMTSLPQSDAGSNGKSTSHLDEFQASAGAADRLRGRAEWKSGFDAAMKNGAEDYYESPFMENIALEITLLRSTVDVLVKRVEWYRAKLADAYHVIGRPR